MGGDGRLRFPRALVEDVIARTRRSFTLHGIDPAHDIEIGGRRVHAGTGGAAPTIMDFHSGKYRESTVADLYDIARLVDRLDNLHWYHRSVVARDAQTVRDLDINTTYACLSGTSKSIAVSYTDAASVKAVLPMLDAVAGGEGRFRDRPFCTAVCCHVVPPMRFATESCEALEAAVEAAHQHSQETGERPALLAVTVLTSLDRGDLDDLGFECNVADLVLSRAHQCLESGCDGVISSGLEVPTLRQFVDDKLLVVSPGIRPVDNKPVGDQKRVVTVETAFQNGCDHIVVGRPIRDADSPREMAEAMQASIAEQVGS